MVGVSETEAVDTFTKEQIREGISAHEKNRLVQPPPPPGHVHQGADQRGHICRYNRLAQRLTLFFSVQNF